MARFRHTDDDEGWINREFAKLWREVREQRSAKRISSSTVGSGGSLNIAGTLKVVGQALIEGALNLTGTLSMKNADGTEMVRMGDMPNGRGLTFSRSDGSLAFRINKEFSTSTVESWTFTDRAGSQILAEATLSPGLARPFMTLPFQPYAATSGTAVSCGPYGWERSTSSATWDTLFICDTKAQNSFLDFKFAAICSDATTAGEIQVYDFVAGAPMAAYFASPWVGTVPAGTTTLTEIDPTPDQVVAIVDGGALQFAGAMRLGVQVRVTAGTGTITLAVPQSMGG